MFKEIFSANHIVTVFITFFFAFAIGFFFKRIPLVRSIIVDEDAKTIRGSFINFVFTVLVAILIGIGAFRGPVADNLMKMETLIIGVYAASFGIYSLKQGYTAYLNKSNGGTVPPVTPAPAPPV
jgi:hypothetical protein